MRVSIDMKAKLETQAAHSGMQYREYLISLANNAAKKKLKFSNNTVTKTTRLEFNDSLKNKIKNLAKESGCSQEEYLLNVFESSINNETE